MEDIIKTVRDINIKIAETSMLPPEAGAAVLTNPKNKDRYAIVLDPDRDEDANVASFLHECLHIYHNVFNSTERIAELERKRAEELIRVSALLQYGLRVIK